MIILLRHNPPSLNVSVTSLTNQPLMLSIGLWKCSYFVKAVWLWPQSQTSCFIWGIMAFMTGKYFYNISVFLLPPSGTRHLNYASVPNSCWWISPFLRQKVMNIVLFLVCGCTYRNFFATKLTCTNLAHENLEIFEVRIQVLNLLLPDVLFFYP